MKPTLKLLLIHLKESRNNKKGLLNSEARIIMRWLRLKEQWRKKQNKLGEILWKTYLTGFKTVKEKWKKN